ncbi:hypothetical protein DPSP01_003433 [Paraphaeosphaeria sporulosa]
MKLPSGDDDEAPIAANRRPLTTKAAGDTRFPHRQPPGPPPLAPSTASTPPTPKPPPAPSSSTPTVLQHLGVPPATPHAVNE